jgi:hypothetical protein
MSVLALRHGVLTCLKTSGLSQASTAICFIFVTLPKVKSARQAIELVAFPIVLAFRGRLAGSPLE